MKREGAIVAAVFLIWVLCLIPLSYAKHPRKQTSLPWDEARRVWAGEYSASDFTQWEKRLETFRSKKNERGTALCLNVLGALHYFEANFNGALRHLNQSLEIARTKGLNEMIARDLFWIAAVQMNQGRWDDALKMLQECVEVAEKARMEPLKGQSLRQIGAVLRGKGRQREAMEYLERAVKIAEEKDDKSLLMFCLNDIGWIHKIQGAYGKAADCFTRSLEMSRKLKHRKMMASNHSALGELCAAQGDGPGALKYYEDSLAIYEDLKDRKGLAIMHNKMGRVYLQMNETEKALQYFEKSHDVATSIGMSPLVAFTAQNMGKVYGRMGRLEDALSKTDEAIQILKEIDSPDPLRDCYHTKGRVLELQGDVAGAESNYKESARMLETLREDVAGGEEEMLAFVEKRGAVYERLIQLLLKQGKTAEALTYMERSRLNKLRDQFDALRPQLSDAREEEAKEKERLLREEIEGTRLQLTEERSKPEDRRDAEKMAELESALNGKKQAYIEYINDLREEFPELASLLAIQPDTLIDLQNLLPPEVAIVQYLILEEGLYIFVVTQESLSYKEVEVSQADLEGKIDYVRSLLMNPQIPLNLGGLEASTLRPLDEEGVDRYEMFIRPFLEASQELHRLLIKPVEEELSAFRVLGIIPNGKLHVFPFQVLGEADPEGTFRFLIHDKALFLLNSQSVLKFAQKRAKAIGDEAKLIAFGNPDNSLKHAEEEIETIRTIFSSATAYLRKDATEDRVKTGLSGFEILHLATHGKLMGNIKESYILLAQSPEGKEDGKLFIREIWGLPLTGYQLVTLSACETAKGKEASGDIMVSLETAFLRAGTPTILASLWEVDDEATGIFMGIFYDNLKRGGKAEAIRAAQMAMLSNPKYVYPYYWAPFVLVGDWR